MDLERCRTESARLGPWAYLATTKPDGRPHVVPVHPCWDGDEIAVFVGAGSQKVTNLSGDARWSMHYTVSPETAFDSLIVEGTGRVVTDVEEKTRLWSVMDYPLEQFGGAGGPSDDGNAFLLLAVSRVVVLRAMGQAGREVWSA